MKTKEYLKQLLKEHYMFAVVLLFFAGYYIYRMFGITPTYDEVYTYIHFIAEGPLYSATHWPLPNNHVFFSVLSSFFTWTGVYGGLRLVSYLAGLGTMVLLYYVMNRVYSKGIAVCCIMLYGMYPLTNANAVQGRGYSLATFMLALAVFCGYQIIYEGAKRRYYILWTVALWLGLYTLVSSIYWVSAICVCFGIVLLLHKQIAKLLRLVLYSACAAVLTLGSYAFLWINMGAQSIQAELGLSQNAFQVFLEYPRTCLTRGLAQMQSNQYMQGVKRADFVHDFKYFFRDIICEYINIRDNSMFGIFVTVIAVLFVIGVVLIICRLIRKESLKDMRQIMGLMLATVAYVVMYIVLYIQSAYPYTRVFSYLGVFVALTMGWILWLILTPISRLVQATKIKVIYKYLIFLNIPLFIYCIFTMADEKHNQEYYMRDYYAYDAVRCVDWSNVDTYVADEIYAKQQIVYHYEMGKNLPIEENTAAPDVVIVCKDENNGAWPFIRTAEEMQNLHVEQMSLIFENELFYVYIE